MSASPKPFARCLALCLLLLTLLVPPARCAETGAQPQGDDQEQSFEIYEFRLTGNTLFPTQRLLGLLDELTGPDRSADDVERARDLLESFHHEAGYPSVLVNIPEQSVEGGIITLQVIESRIGATRLTGNRYFTSSQILDRLPSLAPGSILHAPDVEREVGRVSRNPDLKVTPTRMTPKDLGTIEVELKVEDQRPFHGSLGLDNRHSHDTTPLRANLAAHYDNLWNREHSLGMQYQFSPQDFEEVQVISGSYTLPVPWHQDGNLVLYLVSSNSNTTSFSTNFNSIGKGEIAGGRYIITLPPYRSYNHSAVLGLDYKNFDSSNGLIGDSEGMDNKNVEYLPLSLAYSASLPDASGSSQFSAGLNLALRGLVLRPQNFAASRDQSRGNYLYATLGVERQQALPGGAGLRLKLDGQVADQPLISNEQYAAGGMASVRGFKESEAMGDSALHGGIELSAPDLAGPLGLGERFQLVPYLFYDFANLWVLKPLSGQDASLQLRGTGIGIGGRLFRDLEFSTDLGFALTDSSRIKKGEHQLHFEVKYQF